MGMVSSCRAMELAIEKAKKTGIAYVGVHNSCHFGAAGYYANLAAQQGLLGIAMSNTDPNMAIPGSRDVAIGNKFGFQISLGDGEKKMTDGKNASKQTLLTDAINGCFMSGVGDTSANSIGIAYDAIVTPVSEAVTNTAIASVLFIIAWDAV